MQAGNTDPKHLVNLRLDTTHTRTHIVRY